ncbi:hypothetical protein CFE70_009203 [Pyrenophora teres f. teres 0-1]|nr:hypothetical protein P3342_011910 [Pyrenophora teres f. teres]
MASADVSAQFQEPPVNELPVATSTSATDDQIDAQFQEPIAAPAQTSTSSSSSSTTATATLTSTPAPSSNDEGSSLHKTTTEKLKDAVKKPFSGGGGGGGAEGGSHMLGKKEITSPEMAAANEVLMAKDLKSP